jgi:hypothetical protein
MGVDDISKKTITGTACSSHFFELCKESIRIEYKIEEQHEHGQRKFAAATACACAAELGSGAREHGTW